jgi:hypothetical protein
VALLIARPTPADPPLKAPLVKPTSYTAIWNDKGSGAYKNGSFWRPTHTDADYVACGLVVASNYNQPSLDDCFMVRKDLTRQGVVGQFVYNDENSKADYDGKFI